MEKERKSLFGRLLDFWKERFGSAEADGIGFQYEKDDVENHFAEMGAVAVLSQKKVKQDFLEKTAEEKKQERNWIFEAEEELRKTKKMSLFSEEAKVFREEEKGEEQTQQGKLIFLQEEPLKERKRRQSIPVRTEEKQKTETVDVEAGRTEKVHLQAETQKETEVDVEKLMRQITKKLWEEREGCGRRLR